MVKQPFVYFSASKSKNCRSLHKRVFNQHGLRILATNGILISATSTVPPNTKKTNETPSVLLKALIFQLHPQSLHPINIKRMVLQVPRENPVYHDPIISAFGRQEFCNQTACILYSEKLTTKRLCY